LSGSARRLFTGATAAGVQLAHRRGRVLSRGGRRSRDRPLVCRLGPAARAAAAAASRPIVARTRVATGLPRRGNRDRRAAAARASGARGYQGRFRRGDCREGGGGVAGRRPPRLRARPQALPLRPLVRAHVGGDQVRRQALDASEVPPQGVVRDERPFVLSGDHRGEGREPPVEQRGDPVRVRPLGRGPAQRRERELAHGRARGAGREQRGAGAVGGRVQATDQATRFHAQQMPAGARRLPAPQAQGEHVDRAREHDIGARGIVERQRLVARQGQQAARASLVVRPIGRIGAERRRRASASDAPAPGNRRCRGRVIDPGRPHQVGIAARHVAQALVRAPLDHRAPVEHDDLVAVADRAQAMGDDQARAPAPPQVVVHPPFGGRVEGGGGLVEHQDRGVAGQGAGDGQALTLAAAEVAAILFDARVIATRPGHDVIVDRGVPGGRARPILGYRRIPERQVLTDRALEQDHVLGDDGQGVGEQVARDLVAGTPIECDGPRPGLVQPGDQPGHGRFAAARVPHEGDAGARFDAQREVLEQRGRQPAVAEGHAPQLHAPGQLGRRRSRGRGRWVVRERVARERIDGVAVDVVHAPQAGLHILDPCRQADQAADGRHERAGQDQKRQQGADRETPVHHRQATQPQHGRRAEGKQQRRRGGDDDRGHAQPLLRVLDPGLIAGPPREEVVLRPAGLDALDRAQAAARHPVEQAPVAQQPPVLVRAQPRDMAHGHRVEQGNEEQEGREPRVVAEHQHDTGDDHAHAEEVGRHGHGQRPRDRAGNGRPRAQLAGLALGEKEAGQP